MSSLSDLKEEARYRAEISTSMEGYLAGVDKLKTLQKTINDNTKFAVDLENQKVVGATALNAKLDKQIKYLKDQNVEYDRQVKMLKVAVNQANKYQMALIATGKAGINGLAKLPGLVQQNWGKLKGFGLFEMEKAVKMSALQMGLLGKEGEAYSNSIRNTASSTNEIGVGIEALAKMQGQYTEDLGRSVMLGDKGLKAMAAMSVATGLSAEGTGELAANMDEIGISAERTGDYINQTMNDSHKMGLNASKVVKNIAGNIKMLNKYHFKDGISGLAKMAELSAKLGIKMDFAAGMADKLWDIEGAVDMSAQLQVMGGAWAKMADPFHLMYMAREDMEGLTKEIASASQASMHFAKDGSIEMSSMEMSRLKIIAQQTGLEYDDLVKSGKEMFKMNKVKSQIAFGVPDDMKEFIANTAQLDKNGKATIEIDGSTKLVNQMTAGDQDWVKRQVGEKKSMEERAKAAQNFDDQVTNLVNQFKTYMLPIIDGINQTLGPVVTELMTNDNWKVELIQIGKNIGGFIKEFKSVVTTIADIVIGLGPLKTIAILFGGKMLLDAGKWILNGIALGKGFLATTKGATGPGAGRGGISGKAALGLGIGGMALGAGVDAYTDPGSTSNILGKAAADAMTGAAIGSIIGPWGTAIGAVLGGIYGGVKAYNSKPQTTTPGQPLIGQPMNDGAAFGNNPFNDFGQYIGSLFGGDFSKGRGILQGGKIHPIDNKDDLLAMKKGGVIDKANKGANIPATINHTFNPIEIKGSITLEMPGGTNQKIEILKDAHFLRQVTSMVHAETSKMLNQKQIS